MRMGCCSSSPGGGGFNFEMLSGINCWEREMEVLILERKEEIYSVWFLIVIIHGHLNPETCWTQLLAQRHPSVWSHNFGQNFSSVLARSTIIFTV